MCMLLLYVLYVTEQIRIRYIKVQLGEFKTISVRSFTNIIRKILRKIFTNKIR